MFTLKQITFLQNTYTECKPLGMKDKKKAQVFAIPANTYAEKIPTITFHRYINEKITSPQRLNILNIPRPSEGWRGLYIGDKRWASHYGTD